MRKLSCFLLLFGFIGFYSCEKEAENPGDYNLKSELRVLGVSTKNLGDLDMKVLRCIDTTYVRFYETNDTLVDANGNPILNNKGQLQITKDTTYYNGNITAKFVEIEKFTLDSPIDTIYVSLESNAKWQAPMPSSGGKAQWFFTQRLAGGGDGTMIASIVRNKNYTRSVDAVQYILTSDSTTMYKLVFGQKGEKDK